MKVEQVKDDLWLVSDVLDRNVLNKLLLDITSEPEENWEKVELQEYSNRRVLKWITNGIVDQLWSVLNEYDYSEFGFKFRTVSIWEDTDGYAISKHYDNDRVVGAMLVYLNDCEVDLGTKFDGVDVPYKENTGFVMDNKNKPVHWMTTPVPKDFKRYTVYALFDRTEG